MQGFYWGEGVEAGLSPLYALFSPLYPLFLRLAKIELPLFKNYGMTQRCIEEGPRRGHTCITAGLDPRNMHICKGTTSKMSHITMNQVNELAFWLLCVPLGDEGIYQSFYSAGQDLGSFSASATKAAEPSDHSATPLGSYCGDYCTIFYNIPKKIYIL